MTEMDYVGMRSEDYLGMVRCTECGTAPTLHPALFSTADGRTLDKVATCECTLCDGWEFPEAWEVADD